jgi:glutamine synthetase
MYIMWGKQFVVEYIWVGGHNELRSKIRILYISEHKYKLNNSCIKLIDIPDWNYDGSSTNQATGVKSEIIIKPKAIFGTNHMYVICDTYTPDDEPLFNNYRYIANNIFNMKLDEEPWFGMEQEYFLINPNKNTPLGYQKAYIQGQYYCSVGYDNAFGRHIVEEHMHECLKIGVKLSGINAEVAPGQWEFQVGPCTGIDAGDHLLMARFLLHKIGEKHNVIINIEPKPLKGDWNGSGCHTNYSTKNMREGTSDKTGLEYINEAIDKLSINHKEHMEVYGSGNKERMTGEHETASYNIFTDGIGNRGASVRRGADTIKNGKGYFEDRRPSSNCDPYQVTSIIFKTTCL